MKAQEGYFGPESMMWRVNREMTVLFGGARALLMHSAHPLVAAGARQTGGYRRDPWARLLRTLEMQNLVTFGSKEQADDAAARINKLHKTIHGTDSLTGKRYDALDQDLLLWVHAALEVSTLLFYEHTVESLSDDDKDRYHEENKLAAELLWLERDNIPDTYGDTEDYINDVIDSGDLMISDVAEEVAWLIRTGPVPFHIKPVWKFISFAARGTLDERLRALYGFSWSPVRERWLRTNLKLLNKTRPVLPKRLRLILPARWAEQRLAL